LIESILDYIVCPICMVDLELSTERRVDEEIMEGKLICSQCGHAYRIQGGVPILAPRGTKPYDWFARELTTALERFEPKEAIRRISDGEIGPKRLDSRDSVLTIEELKEGEYKDSEEFLKDRFGGVENARIHFKEQHNVYRKVYDMMTKMARLDKADLMLDVGTGYGYMLQFLAEQFRSAEILAIDISYNNLKAVRGRFRIFGIDGSVHLIAADAHQPPFRDEQFDAIVSWGGQGNIVKFCEALFQTRRILRKNAWFVTDIVGPEKADPDTQKLIEAVGPVFFESNLRKLGLLSTKQEVMESMRECGFQDITSKQVDSTKLISGRRMDQP